MVKKAKGKHRLDKFYHLAKEQGYRSRAAFKLVQLNRKYGFLEKANACLDLCAAPGGWLQVARKTMPMHSLLVGVDLAPIKAIKGCVTFQADITTERCRALLRKEAKGGVFDVVVHDGAPNVGGNWASEAHMQNVLVLESLKLAVEFLPPNGWFVTKVFRSVDYHSLLYAFKQLFRTVEATKPVASRYTSAEIFVVCGGYKAPGKIDERLLDAKHLFNDTSAEPIAAVDVLDPKHAKKRSRQGYEDGISTSYKEISVLDFINSDAPVELLGKTTKFLFIGDEGQMTALLKHKGTTEEIKQLCKDLPVLGRSDFKHLLKWRTNVRQKFEKEGLLQKTDEEGSDMSEEEEEELDEETKLLNEMDLANKRVEKRLKRDKKKTKKVKQTAKIRIAMSHNQEIGGIQEEQDLFALGASQKKFLQESNASDLPTEELLESIEVDTDEEEDLKRKARKARKASDAEGDDKDEYLKSQDKYFELLYRHYKGIKKDSDFVKKRSRLADMNEMDIQDMVEEQEQISKEKERSKKGKKSSAKRSEEDIKADSIAAKWFSQDEFGDLDYENDKPNSRKGLSRVDPLLSDDESSEDEKLVIEKAKTEYKRQKDNPIEVKQENKEIEIVKNDAKDDDDSLSETDFDSDDTEAMAHSMVMKKMFLKSKSKRKLIDDAYNKHAFHDEGLPEWFTADEARHMRPAVELPEEQLSEARDQLKAIDSRTITKVAEAKARKKRKLWKRLEAARAQANQIASSEDMSARGKAREIGKLYANARNMGKRGNDKGKRGEPQKTGRPLDRRMMSDKRQKNMKQKLKDKRKKKGGGGSNRKR